MSNSRTIISGLDIGSTHVTAIIAEAQTDGFKIVGVGKAKNHGVRQGAIVDITRTTQAIKKAKKEAELMSGHYITQVWVSCGGLHVKSMDSSGMVAIETGEVTKEDYARVIKTAQAIVLPDDQQILHVLPKEFFIDGQRGIQNPVGIRGVRMEVDVHIITGAKTYFPNAIKCVESADLKVTNFVLQQLASSLAILSEDEKELGVCLIDIGGGTSDLICFKDGAVIHTGSIPIGGSHFTQDLSIGLRTAPSDAEHIKIEYGHCLPQSSELEEMIEVPNVGESSYRTIARRNICDIIEPRADEVYKLIFNHLEKENLIKKLNAGVVITGGVSQLRGFIDLGKYNYDLPIRRGIPVVNSTTKESVSTSDMAAAVGIVKYAYERLDKKELANKIKQKLSKSPTDSITSFAKQVRDLFG